MPEARLAVCAIHLGGFVQFGRDILQRRQVDEHIDTQPPQTDQDDGWHGPGFILQPGRAMPAKER